VGNARVENKLVGVGDGFEPFEVILNKRRDEAHVWSKGLILFALPPHEWCSHLLWNLHRSPRIGETGEEMTTQRLLGSIERPGNEKIGVTKSLPRLIGAFELRSSQFESQTPCQFQFRSPVRTQRARRHGSSRRLARRFHSFVSHPPSTRRSVEAAFAPILPKDPWGRTAVHCWGPEEPNMASELLVVSTPDATTS
jgi:hypothetical protein